MEDRELVGLVLAGRDALGDRRVHRSRSRRGVRTCTGSVCLCTWIVTHRRRTRCRDVTSAGRAVMPMASPRRAFGRCSIGRAAACATLSPWSRPSTDATRPGGKRVIVVMPAYNAAKTLERTYADIPHGRGRPRSSSSTTCPTTRPSRSPGSLGLDVSIHRQNLGYGGNQKTCYDAALAAGADVVVMLHPDYQYDATRIPALIAPILARRRRPDARQPVPGRPARRRDAALEVRQQPLPDDRREPRRSGSTCPSTTRGCGPTRAGSSSGSRTT